MSKLFTPFSRPLRRSRPTLAALGLLACAWGAQAAPLTAQQVFQQFNLVTLSSASTTSHVDGRAYIGGELKGQNAVFGMHPETMPASSYSALTVAGKTSGVQVTAGGLTALGDASNVIVNNGAAAVAGNASNANFNGSGGSYIGGTKSGVNANSGALGSAIANSMFSQAISTDFAAVLGAASQSLASLASTGSHWTVSGNRVTFHAVAGSDGVAVFNLSGFDSLFSLAEFNFDLGNAATVIFNTDITTAKIKANFLGGSAQAIASRVVWNFYGASSLTLSAQFGGSVLATGATLSNLNNIEGGVYVNSLKQYGEIHQGALTGPLPDFPRNSVPEPTSLLLVLAALGAGSLLRRRPG